MKKGIVIFALILILFFSGVKDLNALNESENTFADKKVEKCFPEYECEERSVCENFFQNRICKDTKCNVRKVKEVRFCEIEGAACRPNITCENWGKCAYGEDLENVLNGRISFGGFATRSCKDLNGCINGFIEESICQEGYEFQLIRQKECEEEFLVANNLWTKRQVAKISLESLNENKLDITVSQNIVKYCASCYNGIKDINETGIDCGGNCKSCRGEIKPLPLGFIRFVFWFFFILFFFLFLNEVWDFKKILKR